MGVIISLSKQHFGFLQRLQRALTSTIKGLGGFKHAAWRSFCNQRKTTPSVGFIDGDLVEMLLELPKSKMAQASHAVRVRQSVGPRPPRSEGVPDVYSRTWWSTRKASNAPLRESTLRLRSQVVAAMNADDLNASGEQVSHYHLHERRACDASGSRRLSHWVMRGSWRFSWIFVNLRHCCVGVAGDSGFVGAHSRGPFATPLACG